MNCSYCTDCIKLDWQEFCSKRIGSISNEDYVAYLVRKHKNRDKVQITDFTFLFRGYGHYRVIYQSPVTYKRWSAITTDMPLIDATKNCDEPKRKDLEMLKSVCKSGGIYQ